MPREKDRQAANLCLYLYPACGSDATWDGSVKNLSSIFYCYTCHLSTIYVINQFTYHLSLSLCI